ncbi:MAG: endopeptidase La, partial [Simkania sp.]|nr:endopeptidase La [Simkania sp.]
QIAKKYLIPKNRKSHGLKANQIKFNTGAIQQIIEGYARESGVRNLENNLKKIIRKVAVEIVKGEQKKGRKKVKSVTITENNLEKYLGKPIFTSDRFFEKTPIGVCTGLAWTAMGGATLYIEAIENPAERSQMKLTGQAGDVMKESAQIAWSYAASEAKRYAPKKTFFEGKEVHVHIPEGATPKDGPSAGITMVTALLSLLMKTPVAKDLGMTGELTLTGKVLPIGGLKEKLIAAKRSKLKTLIFPKENRRDYDELPTYLKKGLKVHFVDTYDEVYRLAFPRRK